MLNIIELVILFLLVAICLFNILRAYFYIFQLVADPAYRTRYKASHQTSRKTSYKTVNQPPHKTPHNTPHNTWHKRLTVEKACELLHSLPPQLLLPLLPAPLPPPHLLPPWLLVAPLPPEALPVEESTTTYLTYSTLDLEAPDRQDWNLSYLILIVEDSSHIQLPLQSLLQDRFHCHTVSSGLHGIAWIQENLPDLIICDALLKKMDGYEVIHLFKNHYTSAHIPIIILSDTLCSAAHQGRGFIKADRLINKPVDPQNLITCINYMAGVSEHLRRQFSREFGCGGDKPMSDSPRPAASSLTELPHDQLLRQRFVDKVNWELHHHYFDAGYNVDAFARDMALSRRQLSRKMAIIMQVSPAAFIRDFRLRKAAVLLRQGLPSAQVAADVGFLSHSHFGQCFKNKYQRVPSQYFQALQSSG
ncbi:MAG: DNA-binding response OmpR family regulator [Alteromonadaceae bacterium]|jgi:DNA-binding response OmpR family regulator